VAPTYYVIELSARWLTILLVALALVMVLAFAFGYGAAWSVLSGEQPNAPARAVAVSSSPTPVITEEVILSEPTPTRRPTRPQRPKPAPTPTAAPPPTRAAPTAVVTENADGFWVQVLASSSPQAMERARDKLDGLGFPAENQRVTTTQVAGGNVLYKLRVGPFPDRDSADRVVRRMRGSGYPDAWVVVP